MPRYLGLDWDNQQLHAAIVATSRGASRVTRAATWQDDFTPGPGRADAVGQQLRERLKAAGLAGVPAVICLGRERVVVKEVRFPQVPAGEEPSIIRFQAAKEFTEPAETLVLDYIVSEKRGPAGERVATVYAIKKDVSAFLHAVCRIAGVELRAILPRGLGAAACLKHVAGSPMTPAPSPEAAAAVLTVADTWADFAVVRGNDLLFSRAAPPSGDLAGEVRRNLAVYAGQALASSPRVEALYVAGNGGHDVLRERLQQMTGLPVHPLDPFAREERIELTAPNRGAFTAAVGCAAAMAGKLPLNLAKPKEPVRQSDPQQRRAMLVGAVLLGLVLVAGGVCWYLLQQRKAELAELEEERIKLEQTFTAMGPDAKHILALKEWTGASVSWLDEFYDLTARFPWRKDLYLTELTGRLKQQPTNRPGVGPKAKKELYAGEIVLVGETPSSDEPLLAQLHRDLNDAHHRATFDIKTVPGASGKAAVRQFTMKVDVAAQEPRSYKEAFTPGEPGQRPPPAEKKKGKTVVPGTTPKGKTKADAGNPGADQATSLVAIDADPVAEGDSPAVIAPARREEAADDIGGYRQ